MKINGETSMSLQKNVARFVKLFSLLGVCTVAGNLQADLPNNPNAFGDTSGNQVAVWELDTDTSSSIVSQIFSSGTWAPQSQISDVSNTDAMNPVLAGNDEGDAAAGWLYVNENGFLALGASTYTVANGWISPSTNLSTTDEDVLSFTVTMNSAGQAVITWNSNFLSGPNAGQAAVFSAFAGTDGSWTVNQLYMTSN
jgi:hypothetical protein